MHKVVVKHGLASSFNNVEESMFEYKKDAHFQNQMIRSVTQKKPEDYKNLVAQDLIKRLTSDVVLDQRKFEENRNT